MQAILKKQKDKAPERILLTPQGHVLTYSMTRIRRERRKEEMQTRHLTTSLAWAIYLAVAEGRENPNQTRTGSERPNQPPSAARTWAAQPFHPTSLTFELLLTRLLVI